MSASDPNSWLTPSEKFLTAIKLQEFGLQMKRNQIKRKHPEATELELDRMLRTWLLERKSVPEGFRRVQWPRK